MGIFLNRDGGVSVFRIGVAAAVLGVLVIIGGYLLASIDQARRQAPFFIDVYPGAEQWYRSEISPTRQQVVYRVQGADPQAVSDFYQRKLDEHYDNSPADSNREQCVRNPARGEFSDYEEGSGNLPFLFTCVFDNSLTSGLGTSGATQFTEVRIEPGVKDNTADPPTDNTGWVMIIYNQAWSK